MMFKCELVDGNIIQERFFRHGESAEEIERDLQAFQWPGASKEAYWRIVPVGEEEPDFLENWC